jgi:hypothetical protein
MTTLELRGLTSRFGPSQDTISGPGAGDGMYRLIDLVSEQGTFTAMKITSWQSTLAKFKVTDFFVDASPRNYIQDAGEPSVAACSDLAPGTYAVYVRYISYSDDDGTASFTAGDTILQVDTDLPFSFELTDEPQIFKVKPKQCINGSRLRLRGINFGDAQANAEVRIGKKADALDPALGKGKLLDRVKHWTDTKVVVKLKVKPGWQDKSRFVWIEKDGQKTNYKKVEILAP